MIKASSNKQLFKNSFKDSKKCYQSDIPSFCVQQTAVSLQKEMR